MPIVLSTRILTVIKAAVLGIRAGFIGLLLYAAVLAANDDPVTFYEDNAISQ
jgi:hypothetical protein